MSLVYERRLSSFFDIVADTAINLTLVGKSHKGLQFTKLLSEAITHDRSTPAYEENTNS